MKAVCLLMHYLIKVLLFSSVSYCPSAGGDDRSISGSSDTSDTSQSDCSIGSRLAIWTESASHPPENVGTKVALHIVEKLSTSQGGGNRPVAKPPRQLQEIGRQSSSDSGIATGSHSSYSGSFSSYTGSLDINAGEDFGSVFSLPPHVAQDLSPCTCPAAPAHDYQVPTSLRYLYDTPRSVLQVSSGGTKDNQPSTSVHQNSPAPSCLNAESAKQDKSNAMTSEGHSEKQSVLPSEETKKPKVAPSSDSFHVCSSLTSSSKTIVTICSVCGGFKVSPVPSNKKNIVLAICFSFNTSDTMSPSSYKWPPENALLCGWLSCSSRLCAQAL